MRGKPTRGRRIQVLHDMADDDSYVALKWAEKRGETEKRRQKPALQQKTTGD